MPSTSTPSAPAGQGHVSFSDIVAPLDPEQFLADYWTRKAVLLRVEGRRFDRFCGWDTVNAVLNAEDCVFPKIKMSRSDVAVPTNLFTTSVGGQPLVDPRAVVRLFRDGASFGITGADSHWPPLRPVVDCIHDALLESVNANIYCSPPNTQGFRCHFDLHEVLVLQLAGSKHWKVFRPTIDAPVESWRVEDAEEVLQTEPYIDAVIEEGDVLYVPRGHWHYAVTRDSMSLHVTMGVKCRNGSAFFEWLGGELMQLPVWRRNAPLLNDVAADGRLSPRRSVAEWSHALKQTLVDKLSEPDVFERFLSETIGGLQPIHAIEMPVQGSTQPLPVDRLRFERPAGRRHVIEQTGPAEIVINVAGSDIQLEGVNPVLVGRIFASPSFTLADVLSWVPDVNVDEVTELLSDLVRGGLLIARRIDGEEAATV